METTLPAPKTSSKSELLATFKLFLPAIILVLVISAFAMWRTGKGLAFLQANRMPAHPEVEERFGVRFLSVTLTANGGLIDFRYIVVDANKAKNFGHYTETAPLIISQETGEMIEVSKMGLHNHYVEQGREYYIVFRNTGNLLKPGQQVTIAIDNLELHDVPVQ